MYISVCAYAYAYVYVYVYTYVYVLVCVHRALQEWNPTTQRFEITKGKADHEELLARKRAREQRIRDHKLQRSDDMARNFLRVPSRQQEEMRGV